MGYGNFSLAFFIYSSSPANIEMMYEFLLYPSSSWCGGDEIQGREMFWWKDQGLLSSSYILPGRIIHCLWSGRWFIPVIKHNWNRIIWVWFSLFSPTLVVAIRDILMEDQWLMTHHWSVGSICQRWCNALILPSSHIDLLYLPFDHFPWIYPKRF